jgi:AAA15 family ATPase/GTPase
MSAHLKQAFENGRTLVIDELDSGLHHLMLEEIVRMFHDGDINKNGAQLIFTTHAIDLLDFDLFRRDQVYLTEKDDDTAASELYSLGDFSVRKTMNIRNGYLLGRFGAVPNIRHGASPWL